MLEASGQASQNGGSKRQTCLSVSRRFLPPAQFAGKRGDGAPPGRINFAGTRNKCCPRRWRVSRWRGDVAQNGSTQFPGLWVSNTTLMMAQLAR